MFLQIVRWDELQPKHAGRKFPWIRSYDSRLDEPAYRKLTKGQRADLLDLELLANRTGNWIPDDVEYFRFTLRTEDLPDVQVLVDAGFVCRRVAGRKAALRQRATATEERRGEVGPEEKKRGEEAVQFLLKDRPGQPYLLDNDIIKIWEKDFPNVDVRDQLKKLAARIADDPADRAPNQRDLVRSCTSWLQRACR
jgi:hypothetical protein